MLDLFKLTMPQKTVDRLGSSPDQSAALVWFYVAVSTLHENTVLRLLIGLVASFLKALFTALEEFYAQDSLLSCLKLGSLEMKIAREATPEVAGTALESARDPAGSD